MRAEKPKRKIWVTKYAFTTGIYTAMAEVNGEEGKEMAIVRGEGLCNQWWGHRRKSGKNDFEFSEEAALARAEQIREDRIASLNRQLGKMKTLKVQVRDECV